MAEKLSEEIKAALQRYYMMPAVIAPPTYDVSAYAVIFIAVLGVAVLFGVIFWVLTNMRVK